MNILEHIEAGHYELDDHSRPMIRYGIAGQRGFKGWITVLATDGYTTMEIVGRFSSHNISYWCGKTGRRYGTLNGHDQLVLLPPPTNKCNVCDRWENGCQHTGCVLGLVDNFKN